MCYDECGYTPIQYSLPISPAETHIYIYLYSLAYIDFAVIVALWYLKDRLSSLSHMYLLIMAHIHLLELTEAA